MVIRQKHSTTFGRGRTTLNESKSFLRATRSILVQDKEPLAPNYYSTPSDWQGGGLLVASPLFSPLEHGKDEGSHKQSLQLYV